MGFRSSDGYLITRLPPGPDPLADEHRGHRGGYRCRKSLGILGEHHQGE